MTNKEKFLKLYIALCETFDCSIDWKRFRDDEVRLEVIYGSLLDSEIEELEKSIND